MSHSMRQLAVTWTCGCVWEVDLEHIDNPTDEQRLAAVTRPSLQVGEPAPMPCPEHGPGQLVTAVNVIDLSAVDSWWDLYIGMLDTCVDKAEIRPSQWDEFLLTVGDLHDHNRVHGLHSLRVGLYTFGVANYEHQADLKYPLFAGTGHDVGKCDILNEVIDHPDFGPEQMEIMRAHPQYGYDRLKARFLFTAFVAGLHHKYQPDGYGIDLGKDAPFTLSLEAEATITNMAKLVMICDFYDAVTTREGPNRDRVTDTMQRVFPDEQERVGWLLANPLPAPT